MTFEDTIEIEANTDGFSYVIIGKKAYRISDGVITDELVGIDVNGPIVDEELNPVDNFTEFFPLAKCFISFNSSAKKVRLNDGQEYIYTYYAILPLKQSIYHLIPKEGSRVRIRKADGTIDKVMEVRGFVTYQKRYLKIWL
jgi:hypothetical protein